MSKRADLVGQRFGRLTVEKYIYTKNSRAYWLCLCDCGKYVEVPTYSLRSGNTKSCGCFHFDKNHESRPESHTYAGDYTSKHRPRLYWVWFNMIRRCEDPKAPDYYRYGELGISVCDEWHDLHRFIEWANKSGWKEGLTLDRVDNSGNYCPENCRWADRITQCNNKRTNRRIEYDGSTWTVTELSRMSGISSSVLYYRLNHGWSVEDAISKPVRNI